MPTKKNIFLSTIFAETFFPMQSHVFFFFKRLDQTSVLPNIDAGSPQRSARERSSAETGSVEEKQDEMVKRDEAIVKPP